MISKATATVILSISLFCFAIASAVPPDTVDLYSLKYIKTEQSLFKEPVKHISILFDSQKAYPSAVFIEGKIIFVGEDGQTVTETVLPALSDTKITESVNGKLIYVHGPFADQRGEFHCLYRYNGQVVFEKNDSTKSGP
jgi:hypothetical protein